MRAGAVRVSLRAIGRHMRTWFVYGRLRAHPPFRAPRGAGGQARAALRARGAGPRGRSRADGGGGLGGGRGVRGRRRACAWGRRCRAAPSCGWCRPTREGVRELWDVVLDRIEAIGAARRSPTARGRPSSRPTGCTASTAGVWTGCSRPRAGRWAAAPAWARRRAGSPPSRRPARPARGGPLVVVEEARGAPRFLAPLPAAPAALAARAGGAAGDRSTGWASARSGELAALPSRAVAERFGHPGLLALDLARGRDTPLEPRRPPEPVSERLELPEAASGQQLERALELLVARVLARRERRGRSLRAVAVSARFVAGGTWREAVTLRHAERRPGRIRLVLDPQAGGAARAGGLAGDRGRGLRPAGAGAGPLLGEQGGRAAGRAWARRCARRARRRATTPRCACSRSTRTRGCPSAARSWRPSSTGTERRRRS